MKNQCYYPRQAYTDGDCNKPVRVPCGRCIGCRLENARQWAIRCTHEAQMHKENSFITLTYNNDNLPSNGSVKKKEMQRFMKDLRKSISPKEVRFYGCGEYGDNLNRPHYHILLFGHHFEDQVLFEAGAKRWRKNKFSTAELRDIYTSEELGKLWKKGFHTIGEVTFESAGYVARYVMKKQTSSNHSWYSQWREEDHYKGREPEFALMSRMPGLGKSWIKKYMTDVYPKGYFHINGKRVATCRYYDSIFQRYCADNEEAHGMYEEYEKMKKQRKQHDKNESPQRLMDKAYHKKLITKPLIRSIEKCKK